MVERGKTVEEKQKGKAADGKKRMSGEEKEARILQRRKTDRNS